MMTACWIPPNAFSKNKIAFYAVFIWPSFIKISDLTSLYIQSSGGQTGATSEIPVGNVKVMQTCVKCQRQKSDGRSRRTIYQSIDLNTSDDEGYLYYSIPGLDSTTLRPRRNLLQKANDFDVRNSFIDMWPKLIELTQLSVIGAKWSEKTLQRTTS